MFFVYTVQGDNKLELKIKKIISETHKYKNMIFKHITLKSFNYMIRSSAAIKCDKIPRINI